MILQARGRKTIRIWQNCTTIDLLTHEGRCRGVLVWDRSRGFALVWARAVVLATGGAGQLYRETTNPPIATADGHAMAYRAGVELRDMEFMQFHPTVLYMAGSARHLLTEALRGEGAYLRDKNGHRFMPEYHPLAELAPRDDVSLAIARQMGKTHHPNVYLDLSHLDPEFIRQRFPGIDRLCQSFDLDITRDPIPVCPGAHYMIGGVTVDAARPDQPSRALGRRRGLQLGPARGQSPGVQQPARGPGVRGGRWPRHHPGARSSPGPGSSKCRRSPPRAASKDRRARIDLDDLWKSLRALMWRRMGITRDAAGMEEAAVQVDHWCRYVLPQVFEDPCGWAMQNMLITARLMIASALQRTESRGVHSRSDYPEPDPSQNRPHHHRASADPVSRGEASQTQLGTRTPQRSRGDDLRSPEYRCPRKKRAVISDRMSDRGHGLTSTGFLRVRLLSSILDFASLWPADSPGWRRPSLA